MLPEQYIGYLISAIVSFAVGNISGFFLRGFTDRMERNKQNSGNTFVLMIVTIIWATSMIVDIVSPAYETSPLVHGLMGAIVGFFYRPFQKPEQPKQ